MSVEAWLLFCATETVLCFTPGPAVLLVVSMALTAGARPGFGAALGILAANTLYFLASATGIGAVLLASHDLFQLVKWIGAVYLIWMGARMILSRGSALESANEPPVGSPGDGAAGATRVRRLTPFAHGLVTQGANPKALMFFTALLPQFIDPTRPVAVQVGVLGASSILIELGVLGLYIAACHRARAMARRPALGRLLTRAGGVLLIGAGAGLAAMRRG